MNYGTIMDRQDRERKEDELIRRRIQCDALAVALLLALLALSAVLGQWLTTPPPCP